MVNLLKDILVQLRVEPPILLHRQSHDGIADGAAPLRERTVLGRGRQQRPALPHADSLEGRPERVARPCLYLDHDKLITTPADEVQLPATGQESGAHDLVAARAKEIGRGLLSGAP